VQQDSHALCWGPVCLCRTSAQACRANWCHLLLVICVPHRCELPTWVRTQSYCEGLLSLSRSRLDAFVQAIPGAGYQGREHYQKRWNAAGGLWLGEGKTAYLNPYMERRYLLRRRTPMLEQVPEEDYEACDEAGGQAADDTSARDVGWRGDWSLRNLFGGAHGPFMWGSSAPRSLVEAPLSHPLFYGAALCLTCKTTPCSPLSFPLLPSPPSPLLSFVSQPSPCTISLLLLFTAPSLPFPAEEGGGYLLASNPPLTAPAPLSCGRLHNLAPVTRPLRSRASLAEHPSPLIRSGTASTRLYGPAISALQEHPTSHTWRLLGLGSSFSLISNSRVQLRQMLMGGKSRMPCIHFSREGSC